jgi:hypothetical protein
MTLLLVGAVALVAFLIGAGTGYGRGLRDGRAIEIVRLPGQRLHSMDSRTPVTRLHATAAEYFAESQIVAGAGNSVDIVLREPDIQLHPDALDAFLDRLGLPPTVLDRIATVRTPQEVGVVDGFGCRVQWMHRDDHGVLLNVQTKTAA